MARTLEQKIAEAKERHDRFLENANKAFDQQDFNAADRLYTKSGYWRDRENELERAAKASRGN